MELSESFRKMVSEAMTDTKPDNPVYRAIKAESIIQSVEVPEAEKYLISKLDNLEEKLTNFMLSAKYKQ
ncbi:hypothetical protein J2TS6_58010 [Paenibacillus albilobatus]|uniref:Uncharacterized protein n=1 Tax=Paenibacillus albilobatus TaxID=2716884 RepID=A0A920CCK3_9BACL|nr:hypothetical protein [Paenibacillus albilobatus]GIO34660.1 hypothetical protein J2TS6_58010 [Paenibacillus albilobatus]